jgi:DNA processing protein
MTFEQAVALSLVPNVSRCELGLRLQADDPELLERAERFVGHVPATLGRAASLQVRALAWNDPRYPAPLLATTDFGPVLWCLGSLDAFDAPAVAIVGSRGASDVALEMAGRLAADLAARGVIIVSGLARGVDSAAHRGALETGRTIAVLGSGLDCIYPAEHKGLVNEIAATGLVISEYPLGTPPYPSHFPQRNRIISGLSRAVIVIEASEKSGSLITASCALEQGRDVMAVPGNALTGRNKGGHALIRDGARIVETADDILEELGIQSDPQPPPAHDRTSAPTTTCSDWLLRVMEAGQAYDLDGLSSLSGRTSARLLPQLLELELRGEIQRVAGGRFMRSRRTC